MPSAFSAKDSKSLVAISFACQKTTPTASMTSLAGWQNGQLKHFPVCLSHKRGLATARVQRSLSTTLRMTHLPRTLVGSSIGSMNLAREHKALTMTCVLSREGSRPKPPRG
jgi:hypothetical protein